LKIIIENQDNPEKEVVSDIDEFVLVASRKGELVSVKMAGAAEFVCMCGAILQKIAVNNATKTMKEVEDK